MHIAQSTFARPRRIGVRLNKGIADIYFMNIRQTFAWRDVKIENPIAWKPVTSDAKITIHSFTGVSVHRFSLEAIQRLILHNFLNDRKNSIANTIVLLTIN